MSAFHSHHGFLTSATASVIHSAPLPLSLSASIALLSSSGAMWPGIKTETGQPEAPSGGQPGFLSFSAAYTSTQPAQLHYSYQGKLQPHSDSQDNAVTPSANGNTETLAVAQLCPPPPAHHLKYCVELLGCIYILSVAVSSERFLSPGSSFTTSSVYSSIPSAAAATTTSTTAAHQVRREISVPPYMPISAA